MTHIRTEHEKLHKKSRFELKDDGTVVAKRRGGAATGGMADPTKAATHPPEGAQEKKPRRKAEKKKKVAEGAAKEGDPPGKGKKPKKIGKQEAEAAIEFQQLAGVSPGPKLRQSPRLKEKALEGKADLLDISTSIRSAHRTLECE